MGNIGSLAFMSSQYNGPQLIAACMNGDFKGVKSFVKGGAKVGVSPPINLKNLLFIPTILLCKQLFTSPCKTIL
jgi:hypothetical protein